MKEKIAHEKEDVRSEVQKDGLEENEKTNK